MEERRRGDRRAAGVCIEERLQALEAGQAQILAQLKPLEEISTIIVEGRAAFTLAARLARGGQTLLRWLVYLTLPGLLLTLLWVAVVNDGHPPAWVREWVGMFK